MRFEIVSATRFSRDDFWAKSALGISLRRLSADQRFLMRIIASNTRGLPQIFNETLTSGDPGNVVVMVHDDVWIDDYFLPQRLIDGLARYDVIGVAGNRRRTPRQPTWAWLDTEFSELDQGNLSGALAHGQHPFGVVTYFGETPAECELLDGVFLAARRQVLSEGRVLFDPRFEFQFYDMDFCRSARLSGLRLGTWPICLTHQSGGGFRSAGWQRGYRTYLEKWGS